MGRCTAPGARGRSWSGARAAVLAIDRRIEGGAAVGTAPAFQVFSGAAHTFMFSFQKRKTGAVDRAVMPLEANRVGLRTRLQDPSDGPVH